MRKADEGKIGKIILKKEREKEKRVREKRERQDEIL